MSSTIIPSPEIRTVADLLDRLGGIPAERVRYFPLPGTAVEQDVIDIEAREDRLCELIDGVLVEKPMGYLESVLASYIIGALQEFVLPQKLGLVSGEAGMMRLRAGNVRIPDVAFVCRSRLPGGRVPRKPIPELAPDLAVEVLSETNTPAEMSRKRREYFESGTRLVWIVDPDARTVAIYTAPETFEVRDASMSLDGGDVLPGFTMSIADLFAQLED